MCVHICQSASNSTVTIMLFILVKVYSNEAHLKEKNNKEVTAKLKDKVNIKLINC